MGFHRHLIAQSHDPCFVYTFDNSEETDQFARRHGYKISHKDPDWSYHNLLMKLSQQSQQLMMLQNKKQKA